jgi:hypothetical protein
MTYILILYYLITRRTRDLEYLLITWVLTFGMITGCWKFNGFHIRDMSWNDYLSLELWAIPVGFLVIWFIRHQIKLDSRSPSQVLHDNQLYNQQLMEMAAWKIINGE